MTPLLFSGIGVFFMNLDAGGMSEQVFAGIKDGVTAAASHLSSSRIELVGMQAKDGLACRTLGKHTGGEIRAVVDETAITKVEQISLFSRHIQALWAMLSNVRAVRADLSRRLRFSLLFMPVYTLRAVSIHRAPPPVAC